MKIEFQGRSWHVDSLAITNKQAEKVREFTKLSVQGWLASLADTQALTWERSFDALYWLMLQQNGEGTGVGIEDVDYPVYRFIEAYGNAYAAEKAAEAAAAEPDPTRPAADSAPSPEPVSPQKLKASSLGGEVTGG